MWRGGGRGKLRSKKDRVTRDVVYEGALYMEVYDDKALPSHNGRGRRRTAARCERELFLASWSSLFPDRCLKNPEGLLVHALTAF